MPVSDPVKGAVLQSATTDAGGWSGARRGYVFAALAVIFFSTSPILIRWAAETLSPGEIAAGRLLLAGGVVLSIALARGERLPPTRRWPVLALIGLVAAAHFGFYIASLNFTTIAHSLSILYTAPVFAALFSWWLLREAPRPRQWLGIALAVAGVAIMAGFDARLGDAMLVGDALALGSAVTFALYSIAGRRQRGHESLLVYAGTVYLCAGLWFVPLVLPAIDPAAFTAPAVASVVALALIPLGLGHTLFNAALRYLPATTVNVIATQEVTGGVLLGILLLGEIPSPSTLAGVAIALAGIFLVLR